MKTFFRSWMLACLAAVSMVVVSCGGGADYRDLLPADSFMTLSVNPASLLEKSGCEDPAQNPFLVRLKSEIDANADLSPEEKEYLYALLENPAESGIDVKKDFFVFTSMDGTSMDNPDMRMGMLLPVGNKSKFDDFIARINEKSGSRTVTENGVSVIVIGEQAGAGAVCAYNDAACVLYVMSNASDDIVGNVRQLFARKRSESLMGNKTIAAQLSERNDMNMVMSYAGMSSLMNNPMFGSMPMMDALKALTIAGSVNFEKGRIVSEAKVFFTDKAGEAKVRELYAYVKPQTGSLLRYLPAASVGAITYGLDGAKMYSVLSAIPGYGMLMNNPLVKQLMEAFDGDFAVAFTGLTDDGRYPVASLLAEVNDPAVLQTIVANLAGMPVQQTAEGEYTLNLGGVQILFGTKGKVLYFTSDAVVKSALDGAEIGSLESIKKIVAKKSGTVYLDFENLSAMIARVAGGYVTSEVESALAVLGMFDTLEASGTMEGGTMVIEMVDKDQNAFRTICETSGELIRRYAPEMNL